MAIPLITKLIVQYNNVSMCEPCPATNGEAPGCPAWVTGLPGLPGLAVSGSRGPRRRHHPPRPQPATGSLEEVLLAVHALPAAEAALGQWRVAVAALEALAVPVTVQRLEDEAVQDVLVAAGAQRDLCRARGHPRQEHRPERGASIRFPSQPRGGRKTPVPARPLPQWTGGASSLPQCREQRHRSPQPACCRNSGKRK